jgi:hypothetical protein
MSPPSNMPAIRTGMLYTQSEPPALVGGGAISPVKQGFEPRDSDT